MLALAPDRLQLDPAGGDVHHAQRAPVEARGPGGTVHRDRPAPRRAPQQSDDGLAVHVVTATISIHPRGAASCSGCPPDSSPAVGRRTRARWLVSRSSASGLVAVTSNLGVAPVTETLSRCGQLTPAVCRHRMALTGWARSARGEAGNVTCGSGLLGTPGAASVRVGRLRHRDGPTDGATARAGRSCRLRSETPQKEHAQDLREFPHGMCTTHADVINADLLAFIKR